MRTSLNEIREIDAHIFRLAGPADALLFDARMILDPGLESKIQQQRQCHALVQEYGRKQLRAEIDAVHRQLFCDPAEKSFADRIRRFFR